MFRQPANTVVRPDLAVLPSDFADLLAIENPDLVVRRAVEVARDRIGLVRVSVCLLDEGRSSRGEILEEHHVLRALCRFDGEASSADQHGAPYTVLDGGVIADPRSTDTHASIRGWVACTPVRRGEDIVGMMFNHAGTAHAPVDRVKQAEVAILCSMLGSVLGSLAGDGRVGTVATKRLPLHRIVMAGIAMLADDPRLKTDEVARRLAMSPRRLRRLYETSFGVTFADYRNRLRLGRLACLVADGDTPPQEAAVAAGFESYAQSQQVSRMLGWMALLKQLAR